MRPEVDEVLRGAVLAPLARWSSYLVQGSDRLDLLQRLSTNDLRPLELGGAVTTLFLSPLGRMLHRVLLVPEDERWRALAEPAPGQPSLPEWIDRYTFAENVKVLASPPGAVLLAGRAAQDLLQRAGVAKPPAPGEVACHDGLAWTRRDAGVLPAWIGVGEADAAAHATGLLAEAGALALGEDGWRQLRVHAGAPEGGAEIAEDWHPLEAGLAQDVSFTKGCYTGQEVVARQDAYGKVARRLVLLRFAEGAPEAGEVLASEEKEGCRLTTVAPARTPDGAHALGYVRTRHAAPGSAVTTARGLAGTVVAPGLE